MRERRSGLILRWAAAVSLAVHVALLAAWLIVGDRSRKAVHDEPDAMPMVELMMIEQKGHGPTTGQAPPLPDQAARTAPAVPSAAPPPAPQPAPQPPAPQPPTANSTPPPPPPPPPAPNASAAAEAVPPPLPTPAAAPPSPAVPTPPKPQMAERTPPPRPPSPPQAAVSTQAAVPASPARPAFNADTTPRINLGGTDSLTNALVEGEQVIPAGPDPKVHNREPVYPYEAVRRGEQGMVVLLIRVSPQGLVDDVDIARSSGFSLLDRAAREAVLTWHFIPAVRDGQPVPSSMPLRIDFQLD